MSDPPVTSVLGRLAGKETLTQSPPASFSVTVQGVNLIQEEIESPVLEKSSENFNQHGAGGQTSETAGFPQEHTLSTHRSPISLKLPCIIRRQRTAKRCALSARCFAGSTSSSSTKTQ